jgi:hypothetical protein
MWAGALIAYGAVAAFKATDARYRPRLGSDGRATPSNCSYHLRALARHGLGFLAQFELRLVVPEAANAWRNSSDRQPYTGSRLSDRTHAPTPPAGIRLRLRSPTSPTTECPRDR